MATLRYWCTFEEHPVFPPDTVFHCTGGSPMNPTEITAVAPGDRYWEYRSFGMNGKGWYRWEYTPGARSGYRITTNEAYAFAGYQAFDPILAAPEGM